MSCADVYRRAGGRRHYNSYRQTVASLRHEELHHVLNGADLAMWGLQKWLAQQMGVSTSTICRDLRAMGYRRLLRASRFVRKWGFGHGRRAPRRPLPLECGYAIKGKLKP